MSEHLKDVAAETLAIIKRGTYRAPSGALVSLDASRAVGGTRTYRPDELEALVAALRPGARRPRIEVTPETTAEAARRLRAEQPVALNFASARSEGGGFLRGAKAQEEDLCRCSALYACLRPQRDYYRANRAHPSALYTDFMIHSPAVPFFRDESLRLLEEPFHASIITAPAPNAGAIEDNEPASAARIPEVLEGRARKVLALAAGRGHETVILGAWGCGAFRCDPEVVASVFAKVLDDPVHHAFARVVFAIHERTSDRKLAVFRHRLEAPGGRSAAL